MGSCRSTERAAQVDRRHLQWVWVRIWQSICAVCVRQEWMPHGLEEGHFAALHLQGIHAAVSGWTLDLLTGRPGSWKAAVSTKRLSRPGWLPSLLLRLSELLALLRPGCQAPAACKPAHGHQDRLSQAYHCQQHNTASRYKGIERFAFRSSACYPNTTAIFAPTAFFQFFQEPKSATVLFAQSSLKREKIDCEFTQHKLM